MNVWVKLVLILLPYALMVTGGVMIIWKLFLSNDANQFFEFSEFYDGFLMAMTGWIWNSFNNTREDLR